ncbi:MAG: phosphotransferase [Bacteroidales bacterium]|nr:phosphotransferase [Candidatus Cryptobacteroides aphodequi]
MEAKLINLDDFVHSGEGFNGESLNHRTNPAIMAKLYNATADPKSVLNELEFAHKVYDLGIPTPKPGEFITDGNGRYGIMFERIVDKKSFSRACGDDPAGVEGYARRFARLCLILHSTCPPKDTFHNVKDLYRGILDSSTFYTEGEERWLRKIIDETPDRPGAIHGDLQFSNAIMAGGKDYFIDLGDFAYGHPYFDLGMVLFTCLYDNEEFLKECFHMDKSTAAAFWHWFVKEYFGQDADPDAIELELRPYAALKLLIIEKSSGQALPEYHWMIQSI